MPAIPSGDVPPVEVRRSTRRRRTVSAHREGDTVVVLLPARMSAAEEQRWVAEMLARLARTEARRRTSASRSDAELVRRAGELSRRWLDGRAEPDVVRWVPPMRSRWASCTPAERSIRVSERLRETPGWVLDYVLVHELAHLLEPGHGPEFWAWVQRYPRTERARGYLEGLSAAAALGIEALDAEAPDVEAPDVEARDEPCTSP
ncbi:M48 family metallopeptidase [Rhodococcus antarcticus]|uniref:M48 family metallopeptidase n=1 Tax=Rhodococcus antarcticus TaxID=2987751 RepID=A0ABY6NXF8_9NOCA|nr:M48 family metallopeptidase [Rhodococcus antarcticus]UZJ23914.1 M48 family metallopeptidase [Rhodococcus antarcticus]